MVRRKLYGCFSCRRARSQLLVCFCICRSNTGIHCWGFAAALLNALLVTRPRGTLYCPKSAKEPTQKTVLGTGGGAFLPPCALAQPAHLICVLPFAPVFLLPLPKQSLAQRGAPLALGALVWGQERALDMQDCPHQVVVFLPHSAAPLSTEPRSDLSNTCAVPPPVYAGNNVLDCCLRTSEKPIPRRIVQDYRMQLVQNGCDIPATV